jgi:hypothetical protein
MDFHPHRKRGPRAALGAPTTGLPTLWGTIRLVLDVQPCLGLDDGISQDLDNGIGQDNAVAIRCWLRSMT